MAKNRHGRVEIDDIYSIPLGDFDSLLAIDERGRRRCFVGYRPPDCPGNLAWWSVSVAARRKDAMLSHDFVELKGGILSRSSFLPEGQRYTIERNLSVELPSGAKTGFGIWGRGRDGEEDIDFTRHAFGGTSEEILAVAVAVGTLTGRHVMHGGVPRLTRSNHQDNACDLTGALIPKNFPYVAFGPSAELWGHVSFYGLFRLAAFWAGAPDSPAGRAMKRWGVDETVLAQAIDAGHQSDTPLMETHRV